MNLDLNLPVVEVVLSRRNLEALLLKLDEPDSKRTILKAMDDGTLLLVRAEDNEAHYVDHEPGAMHPREEARISS